MKSPLLHVCIRARMGVFVHTDQPVWQDGTGRLKLGAVVNIEPDSSPTINFSYSYTSKARVVSLFSIKGYPGIITSSGLVAYEPVYVNATRCLADGQFYPKNNTPLIIIENAGPIITCPAADSVDCGTDPTPVAGDVTVEASCDLGTEGVVREPSIVEGGCNRIYTYVIVAFDDSGRKDSCEWTRTEVCPCDPYCTMTQGYYGNDGGIYCDTSTTSDLLEELLALGPLTIGRAGLDRSFTIQPDEYACILPSPPGGGDSEMLGTEHGSHNENCIPSKVEHMEGYRNNTPAARTLTLSLNVRIPDDPEGLGELIDLALVGPSFSSEKSSDCEAPEAEPVPGNLDTFCIPDAAYDMLDGVAIPDYPTVGDLLQLANDVLGGENLEGTRKLIVIN